MADFSSGSNDLIAEILHWRALGRGPSSNEVADVSAQLAAGSNADTLLSALEAQQDPEGQFDGAWTISRAIPDGIHPSAAQGARIGNGKVLMESGSDPESMARVLVSAPVREGTGIRGVSGNAREMPNCTRVTLQDPLVAGSPAVTGWTQSLDMYESKFTSQYTSAAASVRADHFVLRQFPYGVLARYTVTPTATGLLPLYHVCTTGESLTDASYLVNQVAVSSESRVEIFQCRARVVDVDGGSGDHVVVASAYIGLPATWVPRGHNSLKSGRLGYYVAQVDGVAGEPFTFSVVSIVASSSDFDRPEVEAQRMLVHAAGVTPDELQAKHAERWAATWLSRVSVEPKAGASDEEVQNVQDTNKLLTSSLHLLYCSVREDSGLEVDPRGLSMVDTSGDGLATGHLWLVPLLCFFRPRAAREILDHRYRTLDAARQLAIAHGYAGAQFSSAADADVLRWSLSAPSRLYSSALICLGVWQYFLVTRDDDYLRRRGFEIMKAVADFYATRLEGDSGQGADAYSMTSVVDSSGTQVDGNVLTNYMAKLALQYTIEASYYLGYVPTPLWETVVNKIEVPILTETTDSEGTTRYHVVPTHDGDTGGSLDTLEPLIVLHPLFNKVLMSSQEFYDFTMLRDNVEMNDIRSTDNSESLIALATGYAQLARADLLAYEYADSAAAALTAVSSAPQWGHVTDESGAPSLSLACQYVLSIVMGFAGTTISGGVTSTRFFYQTPGISTKASSTLPVHWKSINMTGMGVNAAQSATTHNRLPYA